MLINDFLLNHKVYYLKYFNFKVYFYISNTHIYIYINNNNGGEYMPENQYKII